MDECVTGTAVDIKNMEIKSGNAKNYNEEINIDELISKGCKRVYDLVQRPLDRMSENDLKRRILEINVSC